MVDTVTFFDWFLETEYFDCYVTEYFVVWYTQQCSKLYCITSGMNLHLRESWEERRYWITISKLITLSYRSISLIRVSPPFAWFQDDFVLNQIRQCEDERFQIQLRHQSLDDTYPTSAIEIAAWLTGKPSHPSCYLGSNKIVNIRTLLFLPSLY